MKWHFAKSTLPLFPMVTKHEKNYKKYFTLSAINQNLIYSNPSGNVSDVNFQMWDFFWFTRYCYWHTNRFCVVQENIKSEILNYKPSLRGLCIKTESFIFKTGQYEFHYLTASKFDSYHLVNTSCFCHVV